MLYRAECFGAKRLQSVWLLQNVKAQVAQMQSNLLAVFVHLSLVKSYSI